MHKINSLLFKHELTVGKSINDNNCTIEYSTVYQYHMHHKLHLKQTLRKCKVNYKKRIFRNENDPEKLLESNLFMEWKINNNIRTYSMYLNWGKLNLYDFQLFIIEIEHFLKMLNR